MLFVRISVYAYFPKSEVKELKKKKQTLSMCLEDRVLSIKYRDNFPKFQL
jgi:hypothetical protein